MAADVGRNDPCPCGSGRKYKKCCLRKRKQAGGTVRTPPPRRRDPFEKAVEAGRQARSRDPHAAIQEWLGAWRLLQEKLPNEVDTLAGAQDVLGEDAPHLQNWVWDVLNLWRRLAYVDPETAPDATDFVEELVVRFSGEEDEFRHSVEAELANLLARAGRIEVAEEIGRRLIAEQPDKARGYCTLADVYLDAEPPKLERALQTLEEAADQPVSDAGDWDLSARLAEVRDALREKEIRTSNDYIEWDTFWDGFEQADLDTKIEMARERIDNAPDFDAEWAFALMIDGLLMPCIEDGRGEAWIETLEHLREKRPDEAAEEAGVLGVHALEFSLEGNGEYVDTALELLFSRPAGAADHVFGAFEVLAFHGVSRVRDHLVEGWPQFSSSDGLMPGAFDEWADWSLLAQLAAWAGEDINEPRTLQDLEAALGTMTKELDREQARAFVAWFLGPKAANFDAATEAEIADADESVRALCLGFARHLVDDHGWPPFKALLGAWSLIGLLRHSAGVQDPFQDRFSTAHASRSRQFRRELKELREPWREVSRFTPHPDLAVGFAEAIADQGMFGRPFTAAAFFEAAARMTPWLQERGFIDNPELTQRTQQHFARRMGEVFDNLTFIAAHPSLLEPGIEQTEQWLNSRAE